MAEIIKTYIQEMPACKFVGKKHDNPSAWGEWFEKGWFELIEQTMGEKGKLVGDGMDAYIGLIKIEKNHFEYWIGEFVQVDAKVPEGFETISFPQSQLGVCWIYGKEKETYQYEGHCFDEVQKIGNVKMDNKAMWSFERYACPRFTTPDEQGNIILDYCFFLEDKK